MPTRIHLPDVIGKGYGDYWRCKTRYRVLKGGKGSKKSTTTALNHIVRLMQYPLANLLVVRAVANTHRDSTFAQLEWAQRQLGVSHLWKNTVSPMEMTYIPTGQKILFRGFDDVLKLASTTVSNGYLCWVWIEEAFEIRSEDDFDKLDLSVPRGEIPPPLYKQTTLTFNPWSETHWLKKRFFDKESENVKTYTTNYLINEWLDDTDRAVFERMKETNARKYAVAGLGEWGIAEGLVYENWEVMDFKFDDKGNLIFDERTVEDACPYVAVEAWKLKHFFGLDYGYTNDPTAFIAFAVNNVDKELYIYDEHYQTRMLNSDIAEMIKAKGYAKEIIRADAAEPKSNDDLRRLGIQRIMPSVKGRDSVMHGIAEIQEYKIFVKPTCTNTIMELSSYCFAKDKDDRGLNKPEDMNNHLMDALRYGFYDVKYFRPALPARKRLTADERINRRYGVKNTDFKGGWT